MTQASKIFMAIFFLAFFALIVTHPAGAAGDMVAGGSVLDNTLAIETGQGQQGGQHGSITGVGSFG